MLSNTSFAKAYARIWTDAIIITSRRKGDKGAKMAFVSVEVPGLRGYWAVFTFDKRKGLYLDGQMLPRQVVKSQYGFEFPH